MVFAVFSDWLPSYIQSMASGGAESQLIISGSKLLVLPILCLDLFRSRNYWFGNTRNLIIIVCLLVMFGLPSLLHPEWAPLVRFRPYLFNVILLFYFAHQRSVERCRFMLLLAVLCSSMVPFAQVLVQAGILQPLQEAKSDNQSVERIFAVTRTATVGLYCSLCIAFIGCMSLVHMRRFSALFMPVAMLIVAVSLATPLFTSQRTVFIVTLLCLIGGYAVYARERKASATLICVTGLLAAPFVLTVLSADIVDRWFYLLERFAGVDLGGGFGTESSAYFRFQEIIIVIERAFPLPEIIGPGVVAFSMKTGLVPHTFIGALYYDGGILMLICYFMFLIYISLSYLKLYFTMKDSSLRLMVGAYSVYFFAFILNSSVMPVMSDRLTAFTLGMGVSLLCACRIKISNYSSIRF